MNKYITNTAEVRPLPFHTWHGEKWEVRDMVWHGQKFFAHLTDALMYAEGVNQLDHLSLGRFLQQQRVTIPMALYMTFEAMAT